MRACRLFATAAVSIVLASFLAACGGGGGGEVATPAAPTPTALPATVTLTVPATAEAESSVDFTSSLGALPAGLTASWDFGDGQSGATAQASHRYAQPGRYTVTLTVRNETGDSRTASAAVTIGRYARLAGAVCSAAQSAGWCWQRPRPVGNTANDIVFADAQTGWAVGEAGQILKTTDGGATWAAQRSGTTARLTQVRFANAGTGWAVGDSNTLLATRDGGSTWVAQASGLEANTFSGLTLTVIDANRALLNASFSSALSYTLDGGANWQQVSSAPFSPTITASGTLWWAQGNEVRRSTDFGRSSTVALQLPSSTSFVSRIAFSDDAHGWVVTLEYDPALFGYKPVFWRTADAGGAWQRVDPAGLPNSSFSYELTPFGSSDGWLWVNGAAYTTRDGGSTWVAAAPPAATGFFGAQRSKALDARTAWFISGQNAYLTRDGGATWQTLAVTGAEAFNSPTQVQLLGSSTVVLSYFERSYRSTDGGASFVRVLGGDPAEANTSLSAVWFFDAARGLAYSSFGRLLDTADGGRTWTPRELSAPAFFVGSSRFQFSDANKGWLLGANREIFRTLDGGQTWSTPVTPSPQTLSDFHFVDATNGWAVGNNQVLRSINAGQSFAAATGAPERAWTAVRFASAQVGLVAGANGAIARTGDAGASWSLRPSGTVNTLRRITFADANNAWAVGDNGTLLSSTDAGLSWTVVPVATPENLNDITFTDPQNGWIVGARGTVLATTDGGVTWRLQASGTTRDLTAAAFIDRYTGWLIGQGGTILATATGGR